MGIVLLKTLFFLKKCQKSYGMSEFMFGRMKKHCIFASKTVIHGSAMEDNIRLSVIIPVYNTEKYLKRCVDSVLENRSVGLEIILVDDGSTDSSPSICDSYSSRFTFVKTIHGKNCGPASAKNRGIEIAKGEYVALIDSDDEVKPDMFVKMLETAKAHNADIVGCNYEERLPDGTIRQFSYSGKTIVLDRKGALEHFLMKGKIYTQCWTKIYRREMVVANNIRNIEGLKTDEDFIFNIHCLVHASTTCVVDLPLYTYSMLPDSLSKAYYCKRIDSYIDNRLLNFDITRRLILAREPSPCRFQPPVLFQRAPWTHSALPGEIFRLPHTFGGRIYAPAHHHCPAPPPKDWLQPCRMSLAAVACKMVHDLQARQDTAIEQFGSHLCQQKLYPVRQTVIQAAPCSI